MIHASTMNTPSACTKSRRSAAFSLVEVMFAILLVGIVYVAAINTLGASRMSQVRTHDHALAYMLAQSQMSEHLARSYDQLADEAKSEFTDHEGWFYDVVIERAHPDAPSETAGHETGAKRIHVTVYRGQVPLAQLVSVRTRAMSSVDLPTGEARSP